MAFIQTANSGTPSGTATVKTVTFSGAQTVGNLNIIAISFGISTGTTVTVPSITVTDSKGNTYVAVGPYKQHPMGGTGANGSVLFYAQNIAAATAGANVVTVTLGTAMSWFIVSVFEYAGINPSSVLDTYVSNSQPVSPGSSPTAVTSGPLTTSSPNDLLFGFTECSDVPASIGSDYTQRMFQYTVIAGDKVGGGAGIYTFTATSGGTTAGWSVWLVAFRQSGTVPPPASTFVQKANSGAPSGTVSTVSVSISGQTAGNLNFVYLSYGNSSGASSPGSVLSVKDDLNNFYLPAGAAAITYDFNANKSLLAQAFYLPQIPGGNRTITATLSAAASLVILGVAEHNIIGAHPFISAACYYGTNSTPGGSASGTAASGNLYADPNVTLIGFLAANEGLTSPGAGYTARDIISTILLEDQQIGNAGVYNASGAVGGLHGWVAQVYAFSILGSPSMGSGEVLLNNPFTASSGNAAALSDGNAWTFWTGAATGAQFAQINAGAACRLSRIRWSCFAGGEDLMAGCTVSACNEPSFSVGAVTTLYTIPAGSRMRTGDLMNEAIINAPNAYQYYRFNTITFASGLEDLDIYVYPAPGCVFRPGDLTLSPCTGNYDLPIYLTLASPLTSAATIHYTIDGSSPTTASPTYTGPFVVSATATLQAASFSPGSVYTSRTLSRPVHIGNTEISTDIVYDNRNYRVWALNGSLWFDPKTKYWYRAGSNWDTPQIYTYGFCGNNVYRSADLRNWEYRSTIHLPPAGQMDGGVTNTTTSISCKTLYNALTNTYVCWTDDYTQSGGQFNGLGKTCWTSPSPEGPFTLVKRFSTIGPISGTNPTYGLNTQGDFSLFLDLDGVTAYLVGCCGSTGGQFVNDTLIIAKLNASFTDFDVVTTYLWSSLPIPYTPKTGESCWITHYGNTYFLMASPTTGWDPNQNYYVTSSAPMGPYTGYTIPFVPVPGGSPDYTLSYDGQGWQIITLPGRAGGYIWHGDRHDIENTHGANVGGDFFLSRRLRLPVIFSNTSASYTIPWNPSWSFDAQMPTLSGAPAAPSRLSVYNNGASATWNNNEQYPCKLYFDCAADPNFATVIGSCVLPDGATSVTGGLPSFPAGSYFRVRAVNANGWSASQSVTSLSGGADSMNPPFMPIVFPPGPPTAPVWEDGPGVYVFPSNSGSPLRYNGQSQTSVIAVANPKPPTLRLPGAADKNISKIK